MSQNPHIRKKIITPHPLENNIKWLHASKLKNYHNSVNNPEYPKATPKTMRCLLRSMGGGNTRAAFTVIGYRVTRDFLECCEWLTTLHKYRPGCFEAPVVRGLTQLEWLLAWNDLKLRYGENAFCISKPVAVLLNNEFLGDSDDLKQLLQSQYDYRPWINYRRRGFEEFGTYMQNSGLFTDLVPLTCENFLRLCRARRGGYGGTPIHRIVADGWVQCGGYGLKSVPLPCENYLVPHDRRGVLSMANDGRYCDNSTQFFINLQPADWMDQKYVAFGQLVDGEETLRKIESVPTRYESPASKIIIVKSGQLTLGGQFEPCRKTIEYLEAHIMNLTALVDDIVNDILETVNLELEYRLVVTKDEPEVEMEHHVADDPVHATERFFGKLKISQGALSSSSKTSDGVATKLDAGSSALLSGGTRSTSEQPAPVREERRVYLPLTDVPYLGECDSDADIEEIKHKCLPALIGNPSSRIPPTPTASQYTIQDWDTPVGAPKGRPSREPSLDSEDDGEIAEFLRLNADRLSFAGSIIRSIARNLATTNLLFNLIRPQEKLEAKGAIKGMRTVVIAEPSAGEAEEEDQAARERRQAVRRRRPTGFERAHPPDDSDSDDGSHSGSDDGLVSLAHLAELQQHDQLKKSVRIAPSPLVPSASARSPLRRPTGFVRTAPTAFASAASMARLLDSAAPREVSGDWGPRLIDYKPPTSMAPKSYFLTSSAYNRRSLLSEPQEERLLRDPNLSADQQADSLDNILTLRHGPRLMRRYSSDYVHSRFMIERAKQRRLSIRTAEFAKKRPSLSVEQYKRKSLDSKRGAELQSAVEKSFSVQGIVAKNSLHELQSAAATAIGSPEPLCADSAAFHLPNLRLPGDTPTYSWLDGIEEPKRSTTRV